MRQLTSGCSLLRLSHRVASFFQLWERAASTQIGRAEHKLGIYSQSVVLSFCPVALHPYNIKKNYSGTVSADPSVAREPGAGTSRFTLSAGRVQSISLTTLPFRILTAIK